TSWSFNGAAPGGAESVESAGGCAAGEPTLQWGRPRGGGVGVLTVAPGAPLDVASMGPPPGGRSRLPKLPLRAHRWPRFNGAAPGGAESGLDVGESIFAALGLQWGRPRG